MAGHATDLSDISTWQENTPLLYDFICVYNLEWPSLTTQWIDTKVTPEGRYGVFLLGTHANEASENYVYILQAELPKDDVVSMENRRFLKQADHAGFVYGEHETKKFKILKTIPYERGEIHKARKSPLSDLAAFISADGGMLVFPTSIPDPDSETKETILSLSGHKCSGWGLAWSHFEASQLVSASDDGVICVWDIEKRASNGTVTPLTTYTEGHTASPQVVITSRDHPAMFISGGDDGNILLWDTRVADKSKTYFPAIREPNSQPFNGLSQNPHRPWLIASGGTDADVSLWDIRICSSAVARLGGHQESVNNVVFCPAEEHYLVSASIDCRVNIWDLREIGKEQPTEMAADGPPELLFSHGGHPAAVQDVDWSPNDDLFVCTVCDANQFHVWRMDRSVFYRESEDDPSEDEEAACDTFIVE